MDVNELDALCNDYPEGTFDLQQGQEQAEHWQAEKEAQVAAWKAELAELLATPDEDYDESVAYRVQCLQADIFAYEHAAETDYNPLEEGLG